MEGIIVSLTCYLAGAAVVMLTGCKTILAAAVAYLLLPTSIATASYLTEEEKDFALLRLQGGTRAAASDRFKYDAAFSGLRGLLLTRYLPYSPVLEREERFKWSEVYRGVFNLQVWLSATAYFAILSGLYSFGLFVSL